MKIEIELSDRLYKMMLVAANKRKMSEKRFVRMAIRNMTLANQRSSEEITASLNKFFEDNPGIDLSWWNDRSWDEYQPKKS